MPRQKKITIEEREVSEDRVIASSPKPVSKFSKDYVGAVGRRRESVARVRLYPQIKEGMRWNELEIEKGGVYANEKPAEVYFHTKEYEELFKITNSQGKFTVTIKVAGGGSRGQIDATLQGIARALVLHDGKNRSSLKKKGYLTRDARTRERRKIGMGGKARRKKQSPKR